MALPDSFTVDRDVPLPASRSANVGLAATLRTMEIGDSFTFEGPKAKTDMTSIRHAAKRNGIKMTIRLVGENCYRAWRIE